MKKARKLKDIDIAEISLVDRPANRKKFLIVKRSSAMEKFFKLLKKWLGEDEVKDEHTERLKALGDDRVTDITKSIEEFDKFADVMPDELATATKNLLKYSTLEYPTPTVDVTLDDVEKVIEKAGAKFSKDTRAKLEQIKRAIDALLTADDKKVDEKDEKLSDETKQKLERLAELEEKEQEREAEKQAEKDYEDLKKKLLKDGYVVKKGGTSKQVKGDGDKGGKGDEEIEKTDEELWPSLINASASSQDN